MGETHGIPGVLAPSIRQASSSIRRQFDRFEDRGLSFSGLLTRVDIAHFRINSAGNGRVRSLGSGSSPSQRS
jgi:hypothetical protein